MTNRDKIEDAYAAAHIRALTLLENLHQRIEDFPAPGMADDDDTVRIDHDRLSEAELVDGLDDRSDRVVVDSRILFVRLDPIKRPHFDLHVREPFQGEERYGRVWSFAG